MKNDNLEDFFPTPPDLIERLLSKVKWSEVHQILEPSAGRGDLAAAALRRGVNSVYGSRRCKIDTIEINPDLRSVLLGKEFAVVHDDFLTFNSFKVYDLIIANFPFSTGSRHLSKAITLLQRTGGRLVCLVNAETIKNTYTAERQAIAYALEDAGAEIEFIENAFTTAARKTSVEVALINVSFERIRPASIIVDHLKKAEAAELEERGEPAPIAERDFVKAMVARFDFEAKAGVRLIDEWFAMRPFIEERHTPKGSSETPRPIIELKIGDKGSLESLSDLVNRYLRRLRTKYWTILVNDPRYTGQYTSNLQTDLRSKLEDLKDYDFSVFNIERLAEDMAVRVAKGVEDAIVALFDKFSRSHAYGKEFDEGNIHYYNGWKTNKVHKVNHKVIIPLHAHSAYSYSVDYRAQETLEDMVKVFNYLSDNKIENTRQLTGDTLKHAFEVRDLSKIDMRYFRLTIYKKGTVHIHFTDKALLDKFNIFVGQRKNWLPPAYGRKEYQDLNFEERRVVDSFQTPKEYGEILARSDYYIVKDAKALLN